MIKQNKGFLERNKYVIYSFFATAISMFMIYMVNQMVPFGDNTILRMDLYHQYGPLFAELYDTVTGSESLIYSWNSGLGSCFLGNYFNYLSSPVAAVILFFGHENITEAIAAMILIKAALASAAFTYYLRNSKNIRNQSFVSVAFSVFYALCAYMLAYYWNVMWLDAMVLLPIILLGIEKIIDYGKISTYVAALALSMFSNYYMSFMLCMFSVVYFFYYFITNYEVGSKLNKKFEKSFIKNRLNSRFLRSCFLFGVGSLLAAGLMAIVLIPVYNILQSCSATSDSFPTTLSTYFNFFDFFANHFASLTTTIRSSGDYVLPNVYCGVLTIMLAPLFFFTKSISKKEKVTTLLLLAFFYISFNVNFLNFVWHGLHFPNDLPYRFSFMYSFILLVMAYKTFLRLNEFTTRHFCTVAVCLVAFVMLTEELTSYNVTSTTIFLTLIFVVIYAVVLSLFKDKKYAKESVAVLLAIFVCSECIICAAPNMSISVEKTPYVEDYDEFTELKSQLDEIENDEFYRMELTYLRTRMDPSWYDYNGVSVFSSMASETLSNLQSNLGMMSNYINSYTYNPQTPVYNMMFSLKYLVNNETVNVLSDSYYTYVTQVDGFEAYSNDYYLPIAYSVNDDLMDWTYSSSSTRDNNPFEIQSDYFMKATGLTESPFTQLYASTVGYSNVNTFSESSTDSTKFYFSKITNDADGSATFYINTETAGNVYIYFYVDNSSEKNITITSSLGTMTESAYQRQIMDLGYYEANETISVNIPFESNTGYVSFYAYTMNDEVFETGYEILQEGQLNIDVFEDTYIQGTATVNSSDTFLYTSIPYDEGWQVYIDGAKVDSNDIFALADSLLAVDTSEYLNSNVITVEFKYEVVGASYGMIISCISILGVAIFLLIQRIKRRFSIKSKLPAYPPVIKAYNELIYLPISSVQTDISSNIQLIQANKLAKKLPVKEVYVVQTVEPVVEEPEFVLPTYDIMDIDVKDDEDIDYFPEAEQE